MAVWGKTCIIDVPLAQRKYIYIGMRGHYISHDRNSHHARTRVVRDELPQMPSGSSWSTWMPERLPGVLTLQLLGESLNPDGAVR